MHRQRVLSALLLIPAFLLLVQFGTPLHFSLVVSVAVGLVAWEFSRLCPAGTDPMLQALCVLGALAWHVGLVAGAWLGAVAAVLVALALTRAVTSGEDFKVGTLRAGWVVVGALYAGGLLGAASLVRGLPDGRSLIYYVAATTWAADTGAYYVGRSLGRRALAPRVSPKKTVEGAAGGIAAAVLAAVAGSGWAWAIPWPAAAGIAVVLSAVGRVWPAPCGSSSPGGAASSRPRPSRPSTGAGWPSWRWCRSSWRWPARRAGARSRSGTPMAWYSSWRPFRGSSTR
jgi:phosphatidate cytidylyltransferase